MKCLIAGRKLESLLGLLRSARHIDGAIAELGVYQGGSLKAMALACPEKRCFGFDTFEGLPGQSWQHGDFHQPGEFGDVDFEAVRRAMPPNVELRRGLFPFTTEGLNIPRVCFAHVDMDLERSTDEAIYWLVPRMAPGGLIVFDDWRWPNCEGVERAIARAQLAVTESTPHQCYWRAP